MTSPTLHRLRAFTMLETILTVTAMGVIAGFSMPLFIAMQDRNELDIATTATVSSLRRAQTLSQSMEGDSTWGVKLLSGSVTVFRGAAYGGLPEDKFPRDTTYDEIFPISSGVVPTGLTEIVFSKLTGDPQQTGTVTLTSGTVVRTVTVNAKGTIDY